MNFRTRILDLYNQGKTVEEIKKEINTTVTEDTILKWKEENADFKKQKKLSKLIKKISKLKKEIKESYSEKDKIMKWKQIIEKAKEILIINPENEIAKGDLINGYMKINDLENAKIKTLELLQTNPNNKIAFIYLANIAREQRNLEEEKNCLERLMAISSEDENQKTEMRLEKVKRLLREKQETQEQKHFEEIKKEQTTETKQKNYANEKMKIEKITYTVEEQEDYIEEISKKFIQGKITKNNLKLVRNELKKYPDETKSLIFLTNLYTKITDKYEEAIEKLEQYKQTRNLSEEERQQVEGEILGYEQIQLFNQKQIEKEEQEDEKLRIAKTEQREYSRQIITKLKKGKIEKQDLPEITKNLESFPDKAKSIFLITKIYEIVMNRYEALKMLAKYTKIENLSYEEKRMIVEMEHKIKEKMKQENSTTEKIRRIYLRKEKKTRGKEDTYKKKIQREKITSYILEGKDIEQISLLMEKQGDKTNIQTIQKIRDSLLDKEEDLQKVYEQTKKTAIDLLEAGYNPNDVYKLVRKEIALKQIKEIEIQNKNIERE